MTFIMRLLILILILIIFLLSYLFYENSNTEKMGNYMNKDELYLYLVKDEDNYYKNFSDKDFKVRNIRTIEEYHNNIKVYC